MSNKIQDPDIQKLAEMMGKEWAGRPLAEALAPGSDSPLAKFIGAFVQASLEQEMQEHLGYKRSERADEPRPNTRNGSFPKTLKTTQGDVEIKVPRDRNGEFEPAIITKCPHEDIAYGDPNDKFMDFGACRAHRLRRWSAGLLPARPQQGVHCAAAV